MNTLSWASESSDELNLQALRSHHPGKPSGFIVRRIVGQGDLWITEYIITYQGRPTFTVSIMEFRDGKVIHETQYFADAFEVPGWRSEMGSANLVTHHHPASIGLIRRLLLAKNARQSIRQPGLIPHDPAVLY